MAAIGQEKERKVEKYFKANFTWVVPDEDEQKLLLLHNDCTRFHSCQIWRFTMALEDRSSQYLLTEILNFFTKSE